MLTRAWCFLFLMGSPAVRAQDYPQLSPFEALRWEGDQPEVSLGGDWFAPVALDGVPVERVLDYCRRTWPDRWKKRFAEDLVEALTRMGQTPGGQMDLVLRALDTRKEVRRAGVPLTRENRERIRRAAAAEAPPLAAAAPERLAGGAVAEDLTLLERELDERYAYRDRPGGAARVRAALRGLREESAAGIDHAAFGLRVQKALALYGDGHTGLADGIAPLVPAGFAPFLTEPAEGGLVALRHDRLDFLDPARPFLRSLDGQPVEKWLAAARAFVPAGSESFVRHHSARHLRYVAALRAELGLPARPSLRIGLADAKGGTAEVERPLAPSPPRHGSGPRRATRRLPGDVGFLRIDEMSDEPADLRALERAMAGFQNTRALVIDVRGNGGGSREPLVRLFPWFIGPKDPPRLVNVAALRLGPRDVRGRPEGLLTDRFLFPLASARWTPAERDLLREHRFTPEWEPPAADFSEWHYLVLRRDSGDQRPVYDRPVAVLMDEGCFSATDIFLGAFSGWRKTLLVGAPSGGGSGRARNVRLPRSGLGVRLSSMASFRPDGRLYDGRGVEPDVRVAPRPTDLLGRTDSVLDEALRRLP